MMRTYRLRATANLRRRRGAASASRSTMRDCQPGPLAFQRARMSGGMRRLIDTFASGDFGRPRGFNSCAAALPMSSGGTAFAGRARLKSAAVHSGFSSSIKPGMQHGRAAGGGKLAGMVMSIEGNENCCREKL